MGSAEELEEGNVAVRDVGKIDREAVTAADLPREDALEIHRALDGRVAVERQHNAIVRMFDLAIHSSIPPGVVLLTYSFFRQLPVSVYLFFADSSVGYVS